MAFALLSVVSAFPSNDQIENFLRRKLSSSRGESLKDGVYRLKIEGEIEGLYTISIVDGEYGFDWWKLQGLM